MNYQYSCITKKVPSKHLLCSAESTNNLSKREKNALLLINGYVRQNTLKWKNIVIPNDIIKTLFIWYYIKDLLILGYEMNDEWDEWDE